MRPLRIENKLKDVQSQLYHWANLLGTQQTDVANIAEWMRQEANRIQILLDSNL